MQITSQTTAYEEALRIYEELAVTTSERFNVDVDPLRNRIRDLSQ